jgi:hypothetical protein
MRRTTYDQGGWKCGAGAVDAVVSDITYVAAPGEFGLVIRKKSLFEKGTTAGVLAGIMDNISLIGENDGILSYGPLFGEEALENICGRSVESGFEYYDDFFDLNVLVPSWAKLGVAAG